MLCEGKETEPAYVKGLKQLPAVKGRTSVRIELVPERDVPRPLVERAVVEKARDEVDEVWCLFDVEHPQKHPQLREALALAEKNGIKLAISNPCFELWLILHHRHWTRPATETRQAEDAATQMPGIDGKHIDTSVLLPLRHDASRRAQQLEKKHERDGTRFPDDNPSSGMHRFLEAIEPTA